MEGLAADLLAKPPKIISSFRYSKQVQLKGYFILYSIIQPPNANNKKNTAIFISRIKKEEYLVKKA